MYRVFRFNIGSSNEMIIIGSLLTIFEASNISFDRLSFVINKSCLQPYSKPQYQGLNPWFSRYNDIRNATHIVYYIFIIFNETPGSPLSITSRPSPGTTLYAYLYFLHLYRHKKENENKKRKSIVGGDKLSYSAHYNTSLPLFHLCWLRHCANLGNR